MMPVSFARFLKSSPLSPARFRCTKTISNCQVNSHCVHLSSAAAFKFVKDLAINMRSQAMARTLVGLDEIACSLDAGAGS